MKLVSLEITPRGDAGWRFGPAAFGDTVTLIAGANGIGKTQIVRALMYCLGHGVELTELIRTRCEAVKVTLESGGQTVRVSRLLQDGLFATISDASGDKEFTKEKEFSSRIFDLLGVERRTLVEKTAKKATPPYVSVFAPIFYVDQDVGWADVYRALATKSFIENQRQEIVRWATGAPAKNVAKQSDELKRAQVEAATLLEQIEIKRRVITALRKEIPGEVTRDAIASERRSITTALERQHAALATVSVAESSMDNAIKIAATERDELATRARSAKRRYTRLSRAGDELEQETGILEQNEVAAGFFREACPRHDCAFFTSVDSYARRVLYLKDQLKDIGSTMVDVRVEVERAEALHGDAEAELARLVEEKGRTLPGATNLIEDVRSLASRLAALEVSEKKFDELDRSSKELEELLNRATAARDRLEQLKPKRGARGDSTGRLFDVRNALSESVARWLGVLNTQNLPDGVTVDDDFRLVLGSDVFGENSSHSGSTRTRIVLAVHAAIYETARRLGGGHPPMLVLDAPRQHELEKSDLRAFTKTLVELAAREGWELQLVMTARDTDAVDAEGATVVWEPAFPFDSRHMFLGPAAKPET